jgi:hypothetical protein
MSIACLQTMKMLSVVRNTFVHPKSHFFAKPTHLTDSLTKPYMFHSQRLTDMSQPVNAAAH